MRSLIRIIKWVVFTRYQKRRFNNKEKLMRWQNKKAKAIAQFAIKYSKFYQAFYSEHSLNPLQWEKLPILNKNIWMKNFNTLNTADIDFQTAYTVALEAEHSRDFSPTIGQYTVGLSSGTSGNRGVFLVSEHERWAWAGAILAKMLPNLFSKQRIAFFLRANSNIYTSLNRQFIQFDFYDLLEDIALHIQKLNQFQPSILVAPPSMLRILATAKQKKKLSIKPNKIISVAEVLEPIDKIYIEQRFAQTVHQIYQATEGFLAITCEYGTLHLNEDLFLVEKEYISSEKFIPIITDLYRRTQPVIRYRLNDVLTERQTACPCGSSYTALDQIDGRVDDLFFLKPIKNAALDPLRKEYGAQNLGIALDEKRSVLEVREHHSPSLTTSLGARRPSVEGLLKVVFPDFIRRAMITSSADLLEYQVIQISPLLLEVNLLCNKKSLEMVKEKIQNNLKILCQKIEVCCPTLHFGVLPPLKKGVKLRRILRDKHFPS